MPYIVIEDFRAGLDQRKMPEASPPGTLQTLVNGHITRGGEIEKRRAMVPLYALPPGQTFGFAGANGVLYTFGSDEAPNVPPGVRYCTAKSTANSTSPIVRKWSVCLCPTVFAAMSETTRSGFPPNASISKSGALLSVKSI